MSADVEEMVRSAPVRNAAVFSLIVCTLGRQDPLRRLLESLVRQRFRDFEVVVVDQNEPGVLDGLIDGFRAVSVSVAKSEIFAPAMACPSLFMTLPEMAAESGRAANAAKSESRRGAMRMGGLLAVEYDSPS